MLYSFDSLWEVLKSAGLPGAVIGLAVLAFVYFGQFTDIFKNGTIRRWAVVVSALLFSGADLGKTQDNVEAALAVVFATLAKFLLDALLKAVKERPAPAKK